MVKALQYLATVIMYMLFVVLWITNFVSYLIIWILTSWFDKKRICVKKFTSLWGRMHLYINPAWHPKLIGKQNINNKACVYVSNHQSMLDIVSLFEVSPYIVWVSKIENFKMPILGTVMRLNGYIQLVREDPRSFPKMFNACSKTLNEGMPVLFFPEGTRSKTGQMGRFKEGAFKVAIENNVPIIPIVMDGIEQAGLKFSLKGGFTIKVLNEITPQQFPSQNPSELKEYVKDIMLNELNVIRGIC